MNSKFINGIIEQNIANYLSSVTGDVTNFGINGRIIRENDITDTIRIFFTKNPRRYEQRNLAIFSISYSRTIMSINRVWGEYYEGEIYGNGKERISHVKLGTNPDNEYMISTLELEKTIDKKDIERKLNIYISKTLKVYRNKIHEYTDIDKLNRIYNYEEDLSFLDKYYGATSSFTTIFNRLIIAYYAEDDNLEAIFEYNLSLLDELIQSDNERYTKAKRVLQDLYDRMKNGSLPKHKLIS